MVAAGLAFAPSAVADTVADEAVVVGIQNNAANPVTWTGAGGVPPEPAHDPENDACGSGCAESLVRVDVDPTYWTDRAGALKVRLCTPDCLSAAGDLADFDLYVYEADAQGRRVRLANFSDARPANAPEVVGVGRPSGYYIVRVVTAILLTVTPRFTVELSIGEGVKFAAIAMGLTCPDLLKDRAETRLSQDSPTIYFDSCAGFVRRLHEPPLYVNLSVPLGAMQPLPTIVMLHGWTGTGGAWRPATADGCYTPEICSAGIYHYNSPWFVTRGYAAISYSARGHGSSCGLDQDPPAPAHACTRGWTHAAERSAEVADTQHLLSLAVDAGIAHPERLGATGGSYGAGQSWLLATAMPWETPRGTKLQLAAAAPTHGWTSLQNSLVPNGRATDSATQTPDALDAPYGVVKRQLVKELLIDSRKQTTVQCRREGVELCPSGFVRFNDTDPTERHSHLASWQAFWEAGEPYEPMGRSFSSEFRGKSAYHAEDYFAGVADHSIGAVPIFAVSGWADPLFPAVETLQMYRRLKQAHPGYPIWMIVDDTGHNRPDDTTRQEQVRSANDRRTAFFDRYLKGEAVDVGPKVVSRPVSCQDAPAATRAVSAASWDLARDGAVTLQGAAIPTQTTAHAGRSAEAEGAGAKMDLPCTKSSGATLGAALWNWKAPAGGTTVLGLPRVSVDYQLIGTDSTVVAKLWDVAPGVDRVRTLLTHGVYRLTAPSSTSSGRLSFQLFGSHWRIGDGHEVELELMQSDDPMFQADKLPSSLVLSSPAVILPTAKR